MLPKLEIHFGNETLRIPQSKKVNLITFAYQRGTLKESILDCYRSRVASIKMERNEPYKFKEITLEDAERQLIKDLREYGNDFVFEKAWKISDANIVGASQHCFYDWISDEEELFEGKLESPPLNEEHLGTDSKSEYEYEGL